MKPFVRFGPMLLGAALAAGCGQEPADAPPAQVQGVTGSVSKGPLQNATVDFYALDGAGSLSGPALIASVTTNASGGFGPVTGLPAGVPILVQTSGGSYIDESDPETNPALRRQITFAAGEHLEAVLSPGQATLAITPYSMALYKKAFVQAAGSNFANTYAAVRLQATNAFGFDPISTIPADPTTGAVGPAAVDGAQARAYAMLLGAAALTINQSAVTGTPEHLPGFADVMAFINDFADGVLDAADLTEMTRRFRNNNFAVYAGVAAPEVDEAALSQPAVVPNIAPTISDIANQSISESSTTGALSFTIGDVEDAATSLTVSGTSSNATLVPNAPANIAFGGTGATRSVTVTPAPGQSGTATITVTVTDTDGDSGSDAFVLTVAGVNDPPVINSTAPTTATEDTLYTYNATVTDPDGPAPTWSLGASHTCGGSIVPATGVFTFTPAGPVPPASCVVQVQVTDGGTPVTQNTTVTITAVNDAPVINSTAPTTATEDTLYTYNATRTDADGPGQTWSLTGSHTCGGSIVPGTGVFTFTPAGPSPPASCVVAVQVSDGGAPNLSATQTTTVTISAANDLPVINSTAPTTATEDTLYTYNATVNDPDGPAPAWSLGASHTCGGSIVPATGVFTFTPAGPTPPASCVVQVQVTDGGTPVTQNTTVTITAVNDLPVINSTASTTATEDTLYTYNATVTDPDGPAPTWSLGASHTCGGSIVPATGVFTFTPAGPVPPASCVVQVQVTDGGTPVTQNTTVTITAVNDAPTANNDSIVVAEGGSATTLVGGATSVLANDTDPESSPLTAVLVSGPANAATFLLNTDGTFTYLHNNSETTTDSFTYRANDGGLNSNIATVTISITPVNDPPVALDDSGATDEDVDFVVTSATLTANDTDPDGPALNVTAVSNFVNGTAVLNAGTVTFTPTPDFFGSASFDYTLSDGTTPDTGTVTVTVNAVNDAPSFTVPPSAPAVNEDDPPQTVTGFATAISAGPANESGQVVSFTISGNTNPALFSAGPAINGAGDLTYTPAAGQSGNATIDVVAVDDGGIASGGTDTSASQSFTITVNAAADGTAWLPYRDASANLWVIDPRQGLAFAVQRDSGVGEHNDASPNNYRTLFGADISGGNATSIRHVRTAYVKGGQLFVANLDTGAAPTPVATSLTDACGIIEMGEDFANPDNTSLFVQTENGDGCDNGNDLPKAVLGLTPSATVVAAPNLQEVKALHDPATGAVTGYLAMFGTSRSDGTTLNRCDPSFNCGTVLTNLHASGGNFNFMEEKGQTLFYLAFRDADDPATRLYRYDVALNDFNPALTAPSPIHQFASFTHNGAYDGSHFYFPDGNALFRVLHTAPTSQSLATAGDPIEDVDLTANRAVVETRNAGGISNVASVPKSGGSFTPLFGRALVANESAQLAYVDAGGRVFMDAIVQSGGTITAESAAQALEDGSGFAELADATWAGGTRATSFNLENSNDLPAQVLLRVVHSETSPTSSDDTLEVVDPATGAVTHTPGLLTAVTRFDGINGDGVGRYMAIEATGSGDGTQDAHLIDTQAGGVQIISTGAGESNWVFFEDVGEDGGPGPAGPVSPPSGMLAWYRAEGNADDIQGLHHGTLFGTTFTSGKVGGQAFAFDGVDDRVDLGTWFNHQAFTVDLWVNPAAPASQVTDAEIVDNNHTGSRSWVIGYTNSGDTYSFGVNNRSSVFFNLTPGVWQHLAVTTDASATLVYLNGILVDSGAGGGPITYDGTEFLRLGSWGGGGRNWNGQMDEASFYNRALSQAEIQAIFNADSFGKQQIDTDADGLLDSAEIELFFTDPGNPDTDGDTFSDGNEVGAGSDPNDPADTPGNDAPIVTVNAGLTLSEGATTLISTSELSAIDGDHSPSDLTYNFGPGPTNGTILVNSSPASFFTQFDLDMGFVSYMHDGTETASDSFAFAVTDAGGPPLSSPPETFFITVTLGNDAPVANPDSYSMDANTTLVVDATDDPAPPLGLLWNDTDEEDGRPPTLVNVTAPVCVPDPAPATCTVDTSSGDGSFTFTPPAGFSGTMTFTYQAHDSFGADSAAPALVTVSVGAAGSLLPLRDGNGSLMLFDPSLPVTPPTNPFEVDNGLSVGQDFSGSTAFSATVDGGTSTFTNIGLARFTYIKGGQVFKVDLRPGFPNGPVQISSIADACRVQGIGEDFADPDNTPVTIERAGPDTDCANQGDNFRTYIRLNMTPGDPGQSPGNLNNVELLRDANGATIGFLTVEGNTVFRRDATFGSPTPLATLDSGFSVFQGEEKGHSLRYLVFQENGQSTRGLYRYDTAGAGTLSSRLYGFSSATPDSGDGLFTYDGADLFFVDGADVLKIAHGSATAVPVASSTVGDVHQLQLTANRAVFEAGSPGNSSVYSVNKDGTGFVTLFNTINAGEQAKLSAVEPGGWVFFTVSGPSGLNANRIRDTGSSPASIGNAYWAGATFPASVANTEANDLDNVVGMIVQGTKGAGFDTLEAYDPATGSSVGTLGTINGTPPFGETVFGGGIGHTFAVAAIVDHAGTIDVDAWIANTQAITLAEVSSVVGADDLWGLFAEGDGGGGGPSACVTPPSGLQAWYTGDGNAFDVQQGNDGALAGGTTYTAGLVNQAFSFDGVDDEVVVPDAPQLNVTTNMTLEAWVYPTADGGGSGIAALILNKAAAGMPFQYAIGRKNSTACSTGGGIPTGNLIFFLQADGGGTLSGMPDDCDGRVNGGNFLALNTWTHVALTYDGAVVNVYVDGALTRSLPASGPIATSTGPLMIGGRTSFSTGRWQGNIDEVQIFNRALSGTEIADQFNAGGNGTCLPFGSDADGDGLTFAQEMALGTNPNMFDTDGDALGDGAEVAGGDPTAYDVGTDTDPTNPDTDGDSLPDGSDPNPLIPDSVPPLFNMSPNDPFGVAINRNSGIGPYEFTDGNDPSGTNTYQVTLTMSGSLDLLDPLVSALHVRDDVPGGVTPGQILMNDSAIVTITASLLEINTTLQSFNIVTNEFDGLTFIAPLTPFSGVQSLDVTVDDLSGPGGQATQGLEVRVRRVELADSTADGYLTRFDGVAVPDGLGVRTSGTAGDFNGDGSKDFVTAAPFASPAGRNAAGQAYVAFAGAFDTPSNGSIDPFSLASSFDGSNGFVIDGASFNDQLGTSYTLAGDLDRDGHDDLVVGAQRALVGATRPGRVYVIFGGQTIPGGTLDLAGPNPGVRMLVFDGLAADDRLARVEYAGDLNRDGFTDLIMAAPTADPGGRQDAGQAYVVFGAPFGTLSPNCSSGMCFYQTNDPTPINRLTQLDGSNGFTVNGIFGGPDTGAPDFFLTGDQIGYSIAPLGDFNGDRVDDVMIGAATADPDGARVDAGQAYVILGKTTGVPFAGVIELSSLGLPDGITFNGENPQTLAEGGGIGPVAAAGDVDGDGKGDLLLGYHAADPGGRTDAGAAYVVYGNAGLPSIVELSNVGLSVPGFRLLGAADGDSLGGRVRKGGDVNRDGIDDLLVNAPGRDPGGRTEAGGVYLIYGKAGGYTGAIDLSTLDGRIGIVYNGAAPGDVAGDGLGTTGDLDDDGFEDFSIGGSQPDLTAGGGPGPGTGIVYAVFGSDLRRTVDSDGDGLSDAYESYIGSNPNGTNSDGDGLDDYLEVRVLHTSPTIFDSDGDGINDGAEISVGDPLAYEPGYDSDPTNPDTDGDGINDGADPNPLVGPNANDNDGDGVSDQIEGFLGSDPNNPNVVVFVSANFGSDGQSGINWGESVRTAQNAVTVLDSSCPYSTDPLNTCFVLFDQTADTTHPGPLALTGPAPRRNVAFVGGLGPGYIDPAETRTLLRVFGSGHVVEISNATGITLGALELAFGNTTIGGGLYIHDVDGNASVVMAGSDVHNNVAQDGGGIAVTGGGSQLAMQDSTVSNNSASSASTNGRGGGLYVVGGSVQIDKTVFRGNTASNATGPSPTNGGGGIFGGTNAGLDIKDSVFAANKAVNGPGGGINAVGATGVVLRHSRLLANESTRPGAGLHAHIDPPTMGAYTIFNNLFAGNASTDSDAEGAGLEIEFNTNASTLEINSNTVAYNQVTTNASTGLGGGINVTNTTVPSTVYNFNNNIAWFNDNAAVDNPATPQLGDDLFLQGPFNAAGNDVNESGFVGNSIIADPLFTQGFFLTPPPGSPAVDAGSGTSASWSLDSTYSTSPFADPDTGTVDIGVHQRDGGDGALQSVFVNTVNGAPPSIVCGSADIIFTPRFQFTNDGSGHLIAVEFADVTGPVLGSLTTLDPRLTGTSRMAKDLGDGRYMIRTNGFGTGTATFSIFADGSTMPATFQLSYTNAC